MVKELAIFLMANGGPKKNYTTNSSPPIFNLTLFWTSLIWAQKKSSDSLMSLPTPSVL
jgi:hypothetical protein